MIHYPGVDSKMEQRRNTTVEVSYPSPIAFSADVEPQQTVMSLDRRPAKTTVLYSNI